MRSKGVQCRAIRRCFLVFTAIALLPLALVYLVTNEQAYKLKGYEFQLENRDMAAFFQRKMAEQAKQQNDLQQTSTNMTLIGNEFLSPSNLIKNGSAKKLKFDNDTTLQTLPDDIVRTMAPSKLELVEQRMKARQKLLAQKCSELGLDIPGNDSIHKPNSWEFLVNHKYHLIWCNVFKSASSSWMYNFNVLAGYSPAFLKKTNEIPLVLARKKYPRVSLEELQEAQNDSITFIIARHPFERLLSAYRDKFIFALPHSYHDKLGSKIVRTYRKNKAERYSPKYPTFSEFVAWLLDEVKKNNFIDMHLVPTTKFCTPCLIKFDIVAKFETLEEDQMYLIKRAGLTNVIMPEWRNTGKGKKTLELLQTFYSQLTRKQLDGLYNYYRYDFEVFGYSAIPYFNIVRTEENADGNDT